MTSEAQILNGSFKSIPIAISSGELAGGRKHAVNQFPSRDTQNVEDLGLQPRRYVLSIIITDKLKQDYFGYRDSLLAALESGIAGPLIHPLYGRIDDVYAATYSLNESFGSFGNTTISVTFEVTKNTGIPESSGNVITQIAAANDIVVATVAADIEENYTVTPSFTGNFQSAVDKINAIIDNANEATSFLGIRSVVLNEYAATIGELSASVNSLVTDPIALADGITSVFESANGLYESVVATFDTMAGFFGFGEDDIIPLRSTAGRAEREDNNSVLNAAVASSALGYSYVAAVQTPFETTRDIDELAAKLDEQYELVQNNGGSQASKDAVTDMRIKVLEALDTQRLNISQIITIETLPTTARLLGFTYYGNDENGELLVNLNNLTDISFIEGEMEVVTA